MQFVFLSLFDYFQKRRTMARILFVLLTLLLVVGAMNIKIEEDISKIFPADKKLGKINRVFQGSRFAERLVVMVSLKDTLAQPDPDKLIAYTDNLVARVQADLSPYIKRVDYRVDDEVAMNMLDLIYDHLPAFLSDDDYTQLDSLTRPETITNVMAANYQQLVSPAGIALKKLILKDPVGVSRIVLRKLQSLQYSDDFELYDNYFLTRDHKLLLFFISPTFPTSDTGHNLKFLEGFDKNIAGASAEQPDITAAYFGSVAIAVGNAKQLRQDTALTATLMVVLMLVLLFGFLRKKRAPFFILIPVLFGGLFSLTAIYFIQGSISVLAIAAGSIVAGIAVNYSLHFFSHLKETRDVRQTVKDLVHPMTLGSATTVLAFLSLRFANASMLSDIGLFAGFSLIGAVLCSLIFLPHLVTDDFFGKHTSGWRVKLNFLQPQRSRILIVVIFLLTPVMLYFANGVSFNSDVTKLNFMSDAMKQAGARLSRITQFATQSVYIVSDGTNLEQALRRSESVTPVIEKLKHEGVVRKTSSVGLLLVSDSLQRVRIEKWNQYWTKEKKADVLTSLQRESKVLKFTTKSANNFDSLINKKYQIADANSFRRLKESFFGDYITEGGGLATVVTLASVDPSRANVFYEAFKNEHKAEAFDRRTVTNLFVANVHADFTFIVAFTSALVFIVLLISYGRIELTLITFIPMLITWIWILGAMALLGIEFNIVNVMISTFIFGLGDDYSIFVMDGLQKEYARGEHTLSSVQDSILLSALTTISGLGVLIFAQHPALKSIAAISIIGIVTVFVMSQTIEPFLFSKLITDRTIQKKQPITFLLFVISCIIYSIFIFGALLLTFIGLVFFRIFRLSGRTTRLIYHSILQFFMKVMIFTGVPIRKRIINLKGQYREPRVIISNHQSFIDILLVTMMSPRVLLLTNNWVWNSPLFGWVVKLADYYPVDAGAEGSVEKLRDRVREGYSIMVFPEGTRSHNGQIKRFHKGAFYIAEKLQLDIQPLLIHGTGESIPKGDFYIGDAELTLKFLPAISHRDEKFGVTYRDRAGKIGQYFREEYHRFSSQIETPRHFRHKLISNFLYKGPVLEWYLRIKLSVENYYEPIVNIVPRHASVLDLGCGYGFVSYLLHFISPDRCVTGVDYDDDKIRLASNGYLRGDQLTFVCSDVATYSFESYDAIILADVLHYLPDEQQEQLLVRCFANVNPEGVVIVRDGDRDLKAEHRTTRVTEIFSTRLLGFNKSRQPLQFISGQRIKALAHQYEMEVELVGDQKFTSNVIFAIRKRNQR